MKNFLLTCALTIGAASSAFAQGTITFANDASTLVTTNDLQGHTGIASAGTQPRVVLYYSTAAVAPPINTVNLLDLTGWTLSSPTTPDFPGTPTGGRFSGGTQTLDQAAGGSSVWVMVRGWTGGFSDWASAYAAAFQSTSNLIGTTGAWLQPTGNPGGTPPTAAIPMTLGASGFNGLVLVSPVPEPSTFALIGLAAGSAFLFGRRRVIRK